MKNRFLRITVLVFLAATVFLLTSCGGAGRHIRFGTAGAGGNYYAFGESFAEILSAEEEDLKIDVKITAGSAANLRLLSGDYISMAIAQADVISEAYNGTGVFEGKEPLKGYSAVAALYTEACQIVTLDGSGMESIRDLRGKRVSIGEKESGTERNAQQILLAYGLSDKMLEEVSMSYEAAAKALKSGEIDAFFCTAGAQTSAIEELGKQMKIRLLPVDGVEKES
ncbi:MAG: TAXI family TRAP transporter solute-binding subunit, partial [Blautia sp.]|nr:TAXI family TRAP transporter solute-binding subunit [Blautia sp.]